MSYFGYILAAYLATGAVLAGLIAWVVLDLRTQREKLQRLEADGAGRRSDVGR